MTCPSGQSASVQGPPRELRSATRGLHLPPCHSDVSAPKGSSQGQRGSDSEPSFPRKGRPRARRVCKLTLSSPVSSRHARLCSVLPPVVSKFPRTIPAFLPPAGPQCSLPRKSFFADVRRSAHQLWGDGAGTAGAQPASADLQPSPDPPPKRQVARRRERVRTSQERSCVHRAVLYIHVSCLKTFERVFVTVSDGSPSSRLFFATFHVLSLPCI